MPALLLRPGSQYQSFQCQWSRIRGWLGRRMQRKWHYFNRALAPRLPKPLRSERLVGFPATEPPILWLSNSSANLQIYKFEIMDSEVNIYISDVYIPNPIFSEYRSLGVKFCAASTSLPIRSDIIHSAHQSHN